MKASTLSFRIAVLMVLAGMAWGLQMAISENHAAFPAHAHLNLLGWVSLFLFGIYYRLHPVSDASRLAIIQVWVWVVGTIVMAIGVGLVHTGRPAGDPLAAAGSVIVVIAMLIFTWIVYRGSAREAQMVPAE